MSDFYPIPPKTARWALRMLKCYDREYAITGDCGEEYAEIALQKGKLRASLWIWKQVIHAVFSFSGYTVMSGAAMLKNYFTITVRILRRFKIFSLLNIAGLGAGITGAILVLLYVTDELSYDRFHIKKDRIYRVVSEKKVREDWYQSPFAPPPVGRVLKDRFPEVQDFTLYTDDGTPCFIQIGDDIFHTDQEVIVDSCFFEIFSFPFIQGDSKTALSNPTSVVLTESFALRCFGTADVLGKTINVRGSDRIVSGILKDLPHNSHLQFGLVVPVQFHLQNFVWWKERMSGGWKQVGMSSTYILTNRKIDIEEFNRRLQGIPQEFEPEASTKIFLQPLTKVYLHSNFLMEPHESEEAGNRIAGNIQNLRYLSLAAACMLLIACINFMNLSTAVAFRRAKEVGVRKVIGSQKRDLIWQFLNESFFLVLLAVILAIFLAVLALPFFNQIAGKQLSISGLMQVKPALILIGMILFTSGLAGSYPAFYLSSIGTLSALKKSSFSKGPRRLILRKLLVVFQFSLAIIVIICASVFTRQFRFIQGQYKTFDMDHMITVVDWTFSEYYQSVKQELLSHPHITGVSQSTRPTGYLYASTEVNWAGKDPADETIFFRVVVDYEYLEVFNPRIVEGRYFLKDTPSDESNFVINETAAKAMGVSSPLGMRLSYQDRLGLKEGIIVGIMEDRPYASPRYSIPPMVFRISHDWPSFHIKVDDEKFIPEVLGHITEVRKAYPDYRPVRYRFALDDLDHYMKNERNLSRIFSLVTLMMISIASLGLLGLTILFAAQKTKEIGIRKILGCSSTGIAIDLSKEFIRWVLVSVFIAWPVAYLLIGRWLQNYAYRIPLGLPTFLIAGGVSLLIAVLTIGWHTIKTGRSNPVEALRYE